MVSQAVVAREGRLDIRIDEQHPLAEVGEDPAEIRGEGGLANPTLSRYHGEPDRHVPCHRLPSTQPRALGSDLRTQMVRADSPNDAVMEVPASSLNTLILIAD